MKIIVLVKQVPDTWGDRVLDIETGRLARDTSEPVFDEVGERAMEVALAHQDATGAEVVALAMGPGSAADTLRKALAMGADSAIHVLDDALAGADLRTTARVLAEAIRDTGFDLIVAGNESTDGRGGVIPAMVAEHLGIPQLTYLRSVEIQEHTVRGERETEYGALTASAPLPAIISVTERSAEARFPSFKGIMKAKKKPVHVLSASDLGALSPDGAPKSRSVVLTTTERPPRVAGRKVVDAGTAGAELAEFLIENRLV